MQQQKSTQVRNAAAAVGNEIRQDIEMLKAGASSLSEHLQKNGKEKASQLKKVVQDQMEVLQEKSREGLGMMDGQIKENPRRSILFAFLAGIAVNALVKQRYEE